MAEEAVAPALFRAVGYSQSPFDTADPGRLCRGRERWIEPFEEDGARPAECSRLVVSGAAFEDDSARDAYRGLSHSGVDTADVIAALLSDGPLLAFMEDGHPADIPDGAEKVEAYDGYRAGGTVREVRVRWEVVVRGTDAIRALLGADPNADRVRGFATLGDGVDRDKLSAALFFLTGMSTADSPPARFQPLAIPDVLRQVPSIVLLHRDKHGPAVGLYSREPVDVEACLRPLCDAAGALLVPFAIPPMLARWDRALAELRTWWADNRQQPFPVPAATAPSSWDPRRRRRRKRKDADDFAFDEDSLPFEDEVLVDPELEAMLVEEDGGEE